MKSSGLLVMSLAMAAAASGAVWAASLRLDKRTDATVCDLAPNTTEVLGRKAFVPANVRVEERSEAYMRLAFRFIAASCSNHQLLILHGEDALAPDAKYMPNVAGELCTSAEIVRTEVTSTSIISGEPLRGFELRCRITKFEQFKASFQANEMRDPTEDFIGRLQKQRPDGQNLTGSKAEDKRDCGKMTLSSVFTGSSCR